MITREIIEKFISESLFEFHPRQTKLCIPIIQHICKKMQAGIKFEEIKICENMLIDGHHRYISARLTVYKIESMM